MTYVLYARALTRKELQELSHTHDYTRLTTEQFLRLMPLVGERDQQDLIMVDNAFTHRFLYRLAGIVTTVDAYRSTYNANHERNLDPWPLPAQDYALVIEHMEFPDGQFSGHHARGEFGLLVPKLA